MPDVAIDRVYGIVKTYTDKTSGKKYKNIVWFMTFRHRAIFYHSRKNLKCNIKVKLDLTKNCYSIITEQCS